MSIQVPAFAFLLILATACATPPKPDESVLSSGEARAWLERYCSRGPRAISGNLIVRANTREFKGQHPASVRFEPNGSFVLEVTHLLGGTLLRLKGEGETFDIESPSKPGANRKGVSRYLGIEAPVLGGLLLGDLPCPLGWREAAPEIAGARIVLESGPWRWIYSRALDHAERVPYAIELMPRDFPDPEARIEFWIDDWDREAAFARKVRIRTSEGELKWTWRSRTP